jgi:phosphoribosylanthranilate isomerase
MSLIVKICGLSTPETLEAALEAGADMIGLVLHPKSPRNVTPDQARALAAQVRGRAAIVALLVNRSPDEAAALARQIGVDWLQLHGSETPDIVRETARLSGRKVLKAVGVAETADLAAIAPYRQAADLVLLDAKPPKDAAYPGGHGRTFDWDILGGMPADLPFMLSGGLDPANVGEAIAHVTRLGRNIAGVDVSSGVERAPGVKDADRIRDFIAAARKAVAGAP